MRTAVAAVAMTVALTACAASAPPRSAPASVLGLSKAAVLSCAGVPEREMAAPGEERLIYARSQPGGQPSSSVVIGGGSDGVGALLGLSLPFTLSPGAHACEAAVILRGGIVRDVILTAGSEPPLCEPIFAQCGTPAKP
jgi:hypothetical protein